MSLKNSSYLKLWWASCYVERNHFSNFDGGPYEEHLCEVYLDLCLWFKEMSFYLICFDLIPVPVKTFSVMSGWVFLG